jgi:glycosyltransferase involved in cell wall biosynthesis
MTDTPLISVVIPAYNLEQYIRSALESIIHQDDINLEIVVLDDGSNDNSARKPEETLKWNYYFSNT